MISSITEWALSVQNPLLHAIGSAFDQDAIYAVILLALLLIGERRNEKRMKVFAVLLLAFLVATGVKYAMAHPRPCLGADYCPSGYSFPSLHATTAFVLAIAFLGKRNYWFYAIFALFVSFTRLNLGVHVFIDVAAGLPIALFCYYAVDECWKFLPKIWPQVGIWIRN